MNELDPSPGPVPPLPQPGVEWAALLSFFRSLRNSPTLGAVGVLMGKAASVYRWTCGLAYYAAPAVLGVYLAMQPGCVIPWPSPNPPTPPIPPIPPAPIPTQGFRALIVRETAQKFAGLSQEVRDYLDSKCVKVGQQPEWRLFDKDQSVVNESKIWQDAMALERATIPWVIISDGKQGFSGPWPDGDKAAQLALLKKYGG